MTDPYTAPGLTGGLTPGHLGAPVQEPEGGVPGPGPGGEPYDPRRLRSGLACCLSVLALAGVLGAAVLAGYLWWPRNEPVRAADFGGSGSGSVQVSVVQGATLTQIGQVLVKQGVVASTRAFTEAAAKSPAGNTIQPGTYTLRQRLPAASALNVLLDPGNANALTIPEGWRAERIYTAVDQKLNLAEGTTRGVAEQQAGELGLPPEAKGNPEGYLFPSTYPVTGETGALGLLQQMVRQAAKAQQADELETVAGALGRSPYELVTIASLVQGEADNAEDMAKVARVVLNRLAKQMPLQFDSTINYALGRSTLTTTATDTKLDSPFNTYLHQGLPPTPIANPGRDGLQAAVQPAEGDWLYFVTVAKGDTRFTDSFEQHQRNVAEFNTRQAARAADRSPAAGGG
ncbi:endolytic transglycosylase MltG [Kitasatospora sp. NPDC096147]|uniref:endolytic transglycosylase MltG n=1 Tax=Kitasatospora sp. NPDC096147 TaxID=3364093 RepID=UPI00382E3399